MEHKLYYSLFFVLVVIPAFSCISRRVRKIFYEYIDIAVTSIVSCIWTRTLNPTPLDTARRIEKIVIQQNRVALRNAEIAMGMELDALARVQQIKLKIQKPKIRTAEKKLKLQEQLAAAEEDYFKKTLISELTRNLVQQSQRTQELISHLVLKLINLFETNPDSQVKADDIKILETTGNKTKELNAVISTIVEKANAANEARLFVIKLKDNLKTKDHQLADALKAGRNTDKLMAAKSLAEAELAAAESAAIIADKDAKDSMFSLKNLIALSLQLQNTDDIFTAVEAANADIEQGRVVELASPESVFMTDFADSPPEQWTSLRKLWNVYDYHEVTPSTVNQHLPTIRGYAAQCTSVLHFACWEGDSMWAILMGLAENQAKGPKTYQGVFPVALPSRHPEAALPLSQENGITYKYDGGRLKREVEDPVSVYDQPVDLLYLCTWSTYCHVRYQLEKFAPLAKKFIIIHNTTACESSDDRAYVDNGLDYSEYPQHYDRTKKGVIPAIFRYIKEHPEWLLYQRYKNNQGLIILKRA